MTELRLPEDLYDAFAVDEACKRFERFATIERDRADGTLILRISATGSHPASRIADELANFALGLTIERQNDPARSSPT